MCRLVWVGGVLLVTLSLHGRAAGADRQPTSYYVSSSMGSDVSDGLTPTRRGSHGPWKTLQRAAAAGYEPGDRLLLKCGDAWTGPLTMHNSGTAAEPITLGTYGRGERPRIRGGEDGTTACVVLDRCAGWRIQGLAMVSARNAIRIVPDVRVRTEYDGYDIEDCFFRDIANPAFPDVARREGSQHNDLRNMGWVLFVDGFESPGPVKLKNLTVRHCVALWSQGFYIHVMGPVGAENVVFDGNTLAHISYNAIYQAGARHFDITNSVLVYGYPWASHPNGATQVLAGGLAGDAAHRNEVSNNEYGWGGDSPACPDGCAYDFEGGTDGVAFRNNLIHDTSGEPVLFMGGMNHKDLLFDGNILRNCVRFSTRWDAYVTVTNSNTGNGAFTHNRFFVQPGKRAFTQKSPAFTFADNEENATGEFVAMPMVTRIVSRDGARLYTLSCATAGAQIRYTTDGSRPTASSSRYTAPIRIRRSGALNIRAFHDGLMPSYVNALIVDLRDDEGRAPTVRWTPQEKRAESAFTAAPLSDTFTIAFWVSPGGERQRTPESNTGVAGMSGQQFALGPLPNGEDDAAGVAVSVGTNGVSVFESAANYRPCMLADDLTLSGWHHIVVVYRQRQPTLYVDGVYEKAGCKSLRRVRPVFSQGRSTEGFSGRLGEVRVYDRVLTEAEIQQIVAATRHP